MSGCGKTTLLRILLGLTPPTNGAVIVDGYPIEELNIRTIRRDIGVVPQNISLYGGNLRKNLCSGLDYSDDQIWHALEMADIADRVHQMPMKLETVVMGGGRSLSGGERQRLTIARALISQPRILIFDEATSALDPTQQSGHQNVPLLIRHIAVPWLKSVMQMLSLNSINTIQTNNDS